MATVERGFSAMKSTKTDWRNSLSIEMLKSLLFISLEGPNLEHFIPMPIVKRWLMEAKRRSFR